MCYENFGSHLKSIRKSRCITQEELSRLLNISRQAYSNYEQGRCVPAINTIVDMSITLNSNLIFCFLSDYESHIKTHACLNPDIPEFEKNALLTLYKSLDCEDRMTIVEAMLIKACRK